MSNHYLIVDDGRCQYVDCDKYFLPVRAWAAKDFADFHRAANNDDDFTKYPPPEKSNRYALNEADARRLFEWMRGCTTPPLRLVSLDDDDYDWVPEKYTRISLYPEDA